ncbi:YIP1 family protein [Litoreibacter albidus]|uniref:Yip1 domain-containing protein n=1 Tax=Litoreibacter albidus TaxID=670155 RepID=A0A1H2TJT2_9RHOB|nr:YIP1 family protein [Litoreibacter albidus]SDW44203.1 Yip1 domain-containing protein [Litoreibacter albidus]
MSTAQAILQSYRAPRAVARRFRDAGADEGTGLGWLFAACILFFIAQLPGLARTSHLSEGEVPLFGLALGTFFGTMLLAPILFYAFASFSHVIARLFGGAGTMTDARLAMFWGLLASAPAVLFQGLVAAMIGPGGQATLVATLSFAVFLWVWINSLIELEGAR